jgi:hypothetical protein
MTRGRKFKSCPRYYKSAGQRPLLSQKGTLLFGVCDQNSGRTRSVSTIDCETGRDDIWATDMEWEP